MRSFFVLFTFLISAVNVWASEPQADPFELFEKAFAEADVSNVHLRNYLAVIFKALPEANESQRAYKKALERKYQETFHIPLQKVEEELGLDVFPTEASSLLRLTDFLANKALVKAKTLNENRKGEPAQTLAKLAYALLSYERESYKKMVALPEAKDLAQVEETLSKFKEAFPSLELTDDQFSDAGQRLKELLRIVYEKEGSVWAGLVPDFEAIAMGLVGLAVPVAVIAFSMSSAAMNPVGGRVRVGN